MPILDRDRRIVPTEYGASALLVIPLFFATTLLISTSPETDGASSKAVDTSTATLDRWTSAVREETDPGLELHRLALRLPQHLIELAFVPLMPVVTVIERYNLLGRFLDLVTNERRTAAFLPVIVPASSSGAGVGGAIVYNEPFTSQDRFIALGLVFANRDRLFLVSFARRFPNFSGRRASLSARYEVDQDTRFFGFGSDRPASALRIMRTEAVDAEFGVTIVNPTRWPEYFLELGTAYRRRKLGVGLDRRGPPIDPDGDLPLPAGFRQALDYPELTLRSEFDSRNSFGVTTRGIYARLDLMATRDLNGGGTSAAKAEGVFATFIPVLPGGRTLFLKVGASGAVPLVDGDKVPFHMMANLGGSTNLRGYVGDRFVDRVAWWASAEYRYRFFEYGDEDVGLSGALFWDVGRVGPDVSRLFKSPMPWSVGLGLRLAHEVILGGRLQFAYSPDGFQVSVGFGENL